MIGGKVWGACGGDDREDWSGIFCSRQSDQGKAIKAICRELKISRKAAHNVRRSNETAYEYERSVKPMLKLGIWTGEFDRMLARNESGDRVDA